MKDKTELWNGDSTVCVYNTLSGKSSGGSRLYCILAETQPSNKYIIQSAASSIAFSILLGPCLAFLRSDPLKRTNAPKLILSQGNMWLVSQQPNYSFFYIHSNKYRIYLIAMMRQNLFICHLFLGYARGNGVSSLNLNRKSVFYQAGKHFYSLLYMPLITQPQQKFQSRYQTMLICRSYHKILT